MQSAAAPPSNLYPYHSLVLAGFTLLIAINNNYLLNNVYSIIIIYTSMQYKNVINTIFGKNQMFLIEGKEVGVTSWIVKNVPCCRCSLFKMWYPFTPFTSLNPAYPMPPLSVLGRSEPQTVAQMCRSGDASTPASIAKKSHVFTPFLPLLSSLLLLMSL